MHVSQVEASQSTTLGRHANVGGRWGLGDGLNPMSGVKRVWEQVAGPFGGLPFLNEAEEGRWLGWQRRLLMTSLSLNGGPCLNSGMRLAPGHSAKWLLKHQLMLSLGEGAVIGTPRQQFHSFSWRLDQGKQWRHPGADGRFHRRSMRLLAVLLLVSRCLQGVQQERVEPGLDGHLPSYRFQCRLRGRSLH